MNQYSYQEPTSTYHNTLLTPPEIEKKKEKKRAFSWDRKKGSLPEKTEHSHELDQIPLIFTKDLLKIDRRQKKNHETDSIFNQE